MKTKKGIISEILNEVKETVKKNQSDLEKSENEKLNIYELRIIYFNSENRVKTKIISKEEYFEIKNNFSSFVNEIKNIGDVYLIQLLYYIEGNENNTKQHLFNFGYKYSQQEIYWSYETDEICGLVYN